MHFQKTIKNSVYFEGKGLHTGAEVKMWIHPAEPGSGIVFKRTDIESIPIPAHVVNVVDSRFATVLGVNGSVVWTVEHVLSALNGLGIDNAFIELHGPEIPAMDGSARDFAEGIMAAGLHTFSVPRVYLAPDEPVGYTDDGRRVNLIPSKTLEIDYTINFLNPFVGRQQFRIAITPENYLREIAPARTFGFLEEVNKLKELQLAKGGGLDNAIVIGEYGIINGDGLRFNNEFVRHKILDLIGDLVLLGYPLTGKVVVEKGGHMLNHLFVREILSRRPAPIKKEQFLKYSSLQIA